MPIKAVLDTSILISAFLKHGGVNALVVQAGKNQYQLFLSQAILEETGRVLLTYGHIRKKYNYSDKEVREYLASLRKAAKRILRKVLDIKVIAEDPDDDFILACALKIKADYIVSKDNHMQNLKQYQGIKIISTQDFLKLLGNKN
ncbi:MAG: putative toxin-antitoxin system toxin component, PIN family [Candidatus Tectomicrobia bacterium]|uniref:Toxin-antitoxin system toxin component, PIN family n=1 Tax=Tectimicrobiota bacterium TaxID=2528274 RepID=A0A933LPW8_UNCTE|nr:putative toxin-antitoxin system toxin component, PIN family [Candidatus Tectomicrobia bacterium]